MLRLKAAGRYPSIFTPFALYRALVANLYLVPGGCSGGGRSNISVGNGDGHGGARRKNKEVVWAFSQKR